MARTSAYYREKAARFREMAKESDAATAASLLELAADFEAEARRLDPGAEPPIPASG